MAVASAGGVHSGVGAGGFDVPPPPPRRSAENLAQPLSVPPGATVWRVGPSRPIQRISEAARLARSGDVVEIDAGDYLGDVAVWEQSQLTIRGVGGAARLYADGRHAEGKAIWVIRRGEFDISNIDFIGARVADRNGAGIRFEGGRLTLRHCLFWGNQMGLLTSNGDNAPKSSLRVEQSEFAYSHAQPRLGHNLYVGSIDELVVVGSYFHHANMGHLLKSRARRSEVKYSRFTDEGGGRAAYELEFPNGGEVLLVGNIVQQQLGTTNPAMVSVGAEGYTWPVNSLTVVANTLVNDRPRGRSFLRVAAGASPVWVANNLLVGAGGLQLPDGALEFNNPLARWVDLVMPVREDYRLIRDEPQFQWRQPPGPDALSRLMPTAQYMHPRRVVRVGTVPLLVGAAQRLPGASVTVVPR